MNDSDRVTQLEHRVEALELLVENLASRVDRALDIATRAESFNRPIG